MPWWSPTARAAGTRSRTAPVVKLGTLRACWSRLSRRSACLGGAVREQPHPKGEHRQRQPLAHRQAEREIAEKAVGLPAELGDEAKHAIADEKQRRYLAARARLGREPPKHREEREPLERELVELRRVTRRVARAAKYHSPGQVRDASVELAVDEVPQPACRDAERTERRDEIHQPQESYLVAARRKRHGEDYAQQAAVEGHPALPHREDLERVRQVVARLVEST